MKGGTTFHFVTDGIEAAVERATAAAGVADDLEVHVVPILLGSGARLFDLPAGWQDRFEPTRLVASPAVAHFRSRRTG